MIVACVSVGVWIVLGSSEVGPDPRKVDTSGASYAALVHVAEVSVSKTLGATRLLHQECRRRVLQAHAPQEDFLPAGHRIVKDLPITQDFPLERGVKRFCQGIISTRSYRCHRLAHTQRRAVISEGLRGVHTAVIVNVKWPRQDCHAHHVRELKHR